LQVYYCDGNATNHAVVSGNNFTVQSSSTIYAVYNFYCNWLTYENNTITSSCSGTSSNYLYLSYNGANNTIQNNTISSTNRRSHYFYGAYSSANTEILGNDIKMTSTDNASYTFNVYGMGSSSHNAKFNNNKLDLTFGSSSTSTTGMRMYWTE